MSSKQGNSRNRIDAKRVARYALLCALCIIAGYIESLLPTALISPGVKLGISNALALTLLLFGDIKGAFAVNITRILLSALLFGSPFSLLFSLAGGIISMLVAWLVKKCKGISPIGISMLSAVVHNVTQIAVACIVTGVGVVYYLPVLMLSGLVCGGAVGYLSVLLLKKVKTNWIF